MWCRQGPFVLECGLRDARVIALNDELHTDRAVVGELERFFSCPLDGDLALVAGGDAFNATVSTFFEYEGER